MMRGAKISSSEPSKERGSLQIAGVWGEESVSEPGHLTSERAVLDHDALWGTCGARGEEDVGEVMRAERWREGY